MSDRRRRQRDVRARTERRRSRRPAPLSRHAAADGVHRGSAAGPGQRHDGRPAAGRCARAGDRLGRGGRGGGRRSRPRPAVYGPRLRGPASSTWWSKGLCQTSSERRRRSRRPAHRQIQLPRRVAEGRQRHRRRVILNLPLLCFYISRSTLLTV